MSDEERELLIKGLELAEYRTLRAKAMRNEQVVHCDDEGNVFCEPARDVFVKLYNEPVPTF